MSTKIKNQMKALDDATAALRRAKRDGCGLLILTGAGMSVASGVPVFRHADGSMSEEFLAFLQDYNTACRRHGIREADDWFDFSVSRMFRAETAPQAWAYWRWRILRARVPPGEDYQALAQLQDLFGADNCFVITSNCDGLHRPFVAHNHIQEVHGSLAKLQCSAACCPDLWDADEAFVQRLRDEPNWVPPCPKCQKACLRPNVMIFQDRTLVETALDEQHVNCEAFRQSHAAGCIVLEIGAGVVVSTIRNMAEATACRSPVGLVRINPSVAECGDVHPSLVAADKYWPIVATSVEALPALVEGLKSSSEENGSSPGHITK